MYVRIKRLLLLVVCLSLCLCCFQLFESGKPWARVNAAGISDWQQITNKPTSTAFLSAAPGTLSISTSEPAYANFRKTFEVSSDTVYTFSADVMSDSDAASICITGSAEKHYSDFGLWQSLELDFNSGSGTTVTVELRHGFPSEVVGVTRFANIKLETKVPDTNWNLLCVIVKNLDVDVLIEGVTQNVQISMTQFDVDTATNMFNKLGNSLNSMSNGQMTATVDIKVIETPLTSLTPWGSGYWASLEDLDSLVSPYLVDGNYDHVFSFLRLTAEDSPYDVPCTEWLGLGGAVYGGIGYSSVRLSRERSNWWYTGWLFPETGLVHEFLHTLERIADEKGIERPALHDAGVYGYTAHMDGNGEWHKWYWDYMNKNVLKPETVQKIGLSPEVYMHNRLVLVLIYEYQHTVLDAQQPAITVQPVASTSVLHNVSPPTLSVEAYVTDGGTLTYQWYISIHNGNTGGTLVPGAESAKYSVPTDSVGTLYYYVIVTNTNNAADGIKTATRTSVVAAVKVEPLITVKPTPKAEPDKTILGLPVRKFAAYCLFGGSAFTMIVIAVIMLPQKKGY